MQRSFLIDKSNPHWEFLDNLFIDNPSFGWKAVDKTLSLSLEFDGIEYILIKVALDKFKVSHGFSGAMPMGYGVPLNAIGFTGSKLPLIFNPHNILNKTLWLTQLTKSSN